MSLVRLTKAGFVVLSDRYDSGPETVRPTEVGELFSLWDHMLDTIAPDFTLGDLCTLLGAIEDVHVLSPLFGCHISEFLDEAGEPSVEKATDMEYLEVYNTAWMNGFDESKAGADAFGPPYNITRDFHGWGDWDDEDNTVGPVAIEFMPVNQIVHLPLRYNPKISFEARLYHNDPLFETELTITLGEFLRAIFWELGFLGSPGDRDEARQNLLSLVDDIDRDEAIGQALADEPSPGE